MSSFLPSHRDVWRREACRAEWRYALKLNRSVVPVEVVKVDPNRMPNEIGRLELVREGRWAKLVAALNEPARPLPNPIPDPPAQPLAWPKIIEIVESTDSVDNDTQFAVAVKLIENIWSPAVNTPETVPGLAVEFLRRAHLDARARRLLQGALQPVSVSWTQAHRVIEDPSSVDGRTQVAVAVKLVEGLWAPIQDAPPGLSRLATDFNNHPDTDLTARRLLQSALQPVSVSWTQVRRVAEDPSSVDGRTQVAVADKLVEGIWSPTPDIPPDISRIATDLKNHPDTDRITRRLLQAVSSSKRAWLPVMGAAMGGLALTHLFWVSGLYGYVNRVLGAARGPIAVNALLALTGIALCVAARPANLKAARLGLLLCAIGVLATLLDAIKIGWI